MTSLQTKNTFLSAVVEFCQVILAGTLTGVQADIQCKVFGGPFHSKTITWAETGLIEGCNRRKCVFLFVHWNEVSTGEVYDVGNWIQFGRNCKDWKYKDLKLKGCKERIWLRGETGR